MYQFSQTGNSVADGKLREGLSCPHCGKSCYEVLTYRGLKMCHDCVMYYTEHAE